MSKTAPNETARTEIKRFLSGSGEWHSVSEIARHTGYSDSHVRNECHSLADEEVIDRRRNGRVIGYSINDDLKVPGAERENLMSLIQTYGSSVPAKKTVDALQDHIRDKVADGVVPLQEKLEFKG
jgi:DNA-binding transcriptional ArsR family regulator